MFLTLSGAQGSGKTTLAEALREQLKKAGPCILLDSFSKHLMYKCRILDIHKYDDINARNCRELFQHLILSELLDVAQKVFDAHTANPSVIVISDRWIPDAYAYSVSELSSEQLEVWVRLVRSLEAGIEAGLYSRKIPCAHFITRHHAYQLQPKLSRATSDPLVIEQHIIKFGGVCRIIEDRDLTERVKFIISHL